MKRRWFLACVALGVCVGAGIAVASKLPACLSGVRFISIGGVAVIAPCPTSPQSHAEPRR